jgi:hypothetical protein
MSKDQHYKLTRILLPFWSHYLSPAVPARFAGGKVVADIPDQRRPLSGVTVTLSAERSGDKRIQTNY